MQSGISNGKKIAWYRIVRFSNKNSLLKKTTLNENHEFSSCQTKETSEGGHKIKRSLKMGNFNSKYPKQKEIKFVKPVLPNKLNILGISQQMVKKFKD